MRRFVSAHKKMLTVSAVAAVVIGLLIWAGYNQPWTGFGPQQKDLSGKEVPAKTLWDWLDLFIVAATLAVGGYLFSSTKKGETTSGMKSARRRQFFKPILIRWRDF